MSKESALDNLRHADTAYRRADRRRGETAERRKRAVRAALESGMTYQQVADVLGLSRSGVQQLARS